MGENAIRGRRVLVTGDGGFIGRHLVAALAADGAEVLSARDRRGNRVDVRDLTALQELPRPDVLYHLAAVTYVPRSFENPRETYDVNVLGTLNALEWCRRSKIGRIVFASSYVYGQPCYLPIDERHPVAPGNPYSRSKVLAEDLCRAYYEDFGVRCTILRVFNVYGEGQNGDFLIPLIIDQLAGGRVDLADSAPRRDFVYVGDVVDAYVRAGASEEGDFEVFNIGYGASYSVADVVDRIVDMSGSGASVSYREERRRNEIMDVIADAKKARDGLGWVPRVGLDEGLSRCLRSHGASRTTRWETGKCHQK